MVKWIVFVFGLIIGSFLNVCIYRIPKKESIIFGCSYCQKCGSKIHIIDMIPVLSYILLGRKCRSCDQNISLSYPMVELLNGLIYLLLYTIFGLSIKCAGMAFLSSILLVVSFIDLQYQMIPDSVILVMIIAGVIYNLFNTELTYLDSLLGFFAASIPLFIIAVVSKGGMGGGDIKLMAAAGIFLGWQLILLSLFLAFIIGSIISIILIVMQLKNRKDIIPFGPFLSAGIFVAFLYGSEIVNWYGRQGNAFSIC